MPDRAGVTCHRYTGRRASKGARRYPSRLIDSRRRMYRWHSDSTGWTAACQAYFYLLRRFMISTTQPPLYDSLRDLAIGTFRILRHTPLAKLGLNRDFHFRLESEEAWHAIGHKLAPKEHWDPILENPGTRSLAIEGTRPGGLAGAVSVRVEPSNKIKHGLFVSINDHFEVDDTSARTAKAILSIAEEQWSESQRRAGEIIRHIGGLC